MKRLISSSILLIGIFSLSGCGEEAQIEISEELVTEANECVAICEEATGKCETLTKEDCLSRCEKADDVKKSCLETFQTCQELAVNCREPEAEKQPVVESGSQCVMACNNYVMQCISLVPGSSTALEKDSYDSCMGECAKWDSEKANCMSIAPNCPSMTEQCGL
ncbi:hypothetical protein C0416_02210 [bacterium]|nr:hypothetical protein [bacterium]